MGGIFISVLGKAGYDLLKILFLRSLGEAPEPIIKKAHAAINRSFEAFFSKFGDEFGKESNSFLAKRKNWEAIFDSLRYEKPDLTKIEIDPQGEDGTKTASKEAIEFLLTTVKTEFMKDFELCKLLKDKSQLESVKNIEYKVEEIHSQIMGSSALSLDLHKPYDIVNIALMGQNREFIKTYNLETENQLEEKRKEWHQGDINSATVWVKNKKNNATIWSALQPETKAKLLCFEGSLCLEYDENLIKAQKLADQSKELAETPNYFRLLALIELRKSGPEAALKVIGNNEDLDTINLKVALLLELKSVEQAQQILEMKDMPFTPNAETFRLKAIAALLSKNISNATIFVQKALELEPTWVNIRYTAAIVDYLSSICPLSIPEHFQAWPEPIHPILVFSDDTSRSRLAKAAKFFQQMLTESRENLNENKKHLFQVWRLASIANDPTLQFEAKQYCQEILSEDQINPYAIVWAEARGYINKNRQYVKRLENYLENNPASLSHVFSLILCHISNKENTKAFEIIDNYENQFILEGQANLVRFWKARILTMQGDLSEAMDILDKSPQTPEFQFAKIQAVRKSPPNDNLNGINNNCNEDELCENIAPIILIERCNYWASIGQWVKVYHHENLLLTKVGTSGAIRLLAYAMFNQKEHDKCLNLLDENISKFPNCKLGHDLRKIRSRCFQARGMFPTAIADAEELMAEKPTVDNLLTLGKLYLSKGDLQSITSIARRIIKIPDVTSNQLLQLARLVILDNPKFAEKLWKQAISKGIKDEDVVLAVPIGIQIGNNDDDLRILIQRMATLGKTGHSSVQLTAFDEFVDHINNQRKTNELLVEQYQNGKIPIHYIAERLRITLPEMYHGVLQENEISNEFLKSIPLFVFHGGKKITTGFPDSFPEWRINIDITSLLLAAHFGFLEKLENAFSPLMIVPELMLLFTQIKEDLSDKQPSRTCEIKRLLELIDNHKLSIHDLIFTPQYNHQIIEQQISNRKLNLFAASDKLKGYVLDLYPITDEKGLPIPEQLFNTYKSKLVGISDILESLYGLGAISANDYSKKKEIIFNRNYDHQFNANLGKGTIILCEIGTAQILLGLELLELASQIFDIRLGKDEYNYLLKETKATDTKKKILNWVSDLTDHLSENIDSGIYKIIPISHKKAIEPDQRSVLANSLSSILLAESDEKDVACFADRFMNGFESIESMRVIDIRDILKALIANKYLQKSEYFDIIHRMRASNIRYLPVEVDELLYYLNQAFAEGIIVESKELQTLKRYVATCLFQNSYLQRPINPNGPTNEHGEVAFIISIQKGCLDSISQLWENLSLDKSLKIAMSEWVINNLFVENLRQFYQTNEEEANPNNLYFASLFNSFLITHALFIERDNQADRNSNSKEYLNWVFERILKKRFESDPELQKSTIEMIAKSLANGKAYLTEKVPEEFACAYINDFFRNIPPLMQAELEKDSEFIRKIGIQIQPLIALGDLQFKTESFWEAIRKARDGSQTSLQTYDNSFSINLALVEHDDKAQGLYFLHPKSNKHISVKDEIFGVLTSNVSELESTLKRNKNWFDCRISLFDEAVATIISEENFLTRVKMVEKWRETSVTEYYITLRETILKEKYFQFKNLNPPNFSKLLSYFSFEVSDLDFCQIYENAANTLIEEKHLLFAVERLINFPVPLPSSLEKKLRQSNKNEKRAILNKLLNTAGSPIARFHLLKLLFILEENARKRERIKTLLLRRLIGKEGINELSSFITLLQWVTNEFSHFSEFATLPTALRLATIWGHTNQLFSIFESLGANPDYLHKIFNSIEPRVSGSELIYENSFFSDAACPFRVNKELLLLKGISYALEDYSKEFADTIAGKHLKEFMFEKNEDSRYPKMELFRDLSLCKDNLRSFLAFSQEKALGITHGPDFLSQLSQSSLSKNLSESVDKIFIEPTDTSAWFFLMAIVSDLESKPDMFERIKSLILSVDLCNIFPGNETAGRLALSFISSQAQHYKDLQVLSHIEKQCMLACRFFSVRYPMHPKKENESQFNQFNEAVDSLIGAAQLIALAKGANLFWMEFAKILSKMVDEWLPLSKNLNPIVTKLCSGLPVSKAKGFWDLKVKLRAIS